MSSGESSPPGALVALIVFLIALLMLSVGAEHKGIPASAACITLGACLGLLLGPTGLGAEWGVDKSMAAFNRDLFYYVLLPPFGDLDCTAGTKGWSRRRSLGPCGQKRNQNQNKN